jgi:chromosome segregation ATPase
VIDEKADEEPSPSSDAEPTTPVETEAHRLERLVRESIERQRDADERERVMHERSEQSIDELRRRVDQNTGAIAELHADFLDEQRASHRFAEATMARFSHVDAKIDASETRVLDGLLRLESAVRSVDKRLAEHMAAVAATPEDQERLRVRLESLTDELEDTKTERTRAEERRREAEIEAARAKAEADVKVAALREARESHVEAEREEREEQREIRHERRDDARHVWRTGVALVSAVVLAAASAYFAGRWAAQQHAAPHPQFEAAPSASH